MLDLGADLGRLEEDDLAEGVLRVPGDPEGGLLAVDLRPVVLGVVLEIVGIALVGHGGNLSVLGTVADIRTARSISGSPLPVSATVVVK